MADKITGCVFNIQKFCTNDGPGIRTTVFLKGCPLDCMWCHNPESKSRLPQLSFNKDKCTYCGACLEVCAPKGHAFEENKHSLDRSLCVMCGRCAGACPSGSLEVIGQTMDADEVMKAVLKDKPFYRGEGGMTVSGGEPFYQFSFLMELLKSARENGIHTCVETSGFTSRANMEKAAEYIDLFLYDCKLTTNEAHKKYTGVPNEPILENLFMVDEMGKKVILRCPIIPGINDNDEHFQGIANIANKLKNIVRVEVMAYHSLGESKAQNTDMEYLLHGVEHMSEDRAKEIVAKIASLTDVAVKRG